MSWKKHKNDKMKEKAVAFSPPCNRPFFLSAFLLFIFFLNYIYSTLHYSRKIQQKHRFPDKNRTSTRVTFYGCLFSTEMEKNIEKGRMFFSSLSFPHTTRLGRVSFPCLACIRCYVATVTSFYCASFFSCSFVFCSKRSRSFFN